MMLCFQNIEQNMSKVNKLSKLPYSTWVEFSKCCNFFENGLKLFSLVLYTSFFLAVITDMGHSIGLGDKV